MPLLMCSALQDTGDLKWSDGQGLTQGLGRCCSCRLVLKALQGLELLPLLKLSQLIRLYLLH